MRSALFPLALLAVLLLALPGLILFACSAAGWQLDASRWLEDRTGLGYHLPLPVMWTAFLFLTIPLLILLYFLKLRRKPLAVPSTFLWKKSIEDLRVNSLFQWLRNNVLLLMQLLILIALIYAVLGPRLHGQNGSGRHYILMIDNSASMAATDVSPSRLSWAKDEAIRQIDLMTDSDFGMVIAFNSGAEILQSYTSNRELLRQAIRNLEPTFRPTRLDEALSLADSLANPTRSTDNAAVAPGNAEPGKERTYVAPEGVPTTLHIFSDGRFPDMPDFAPGNLDVRYRMAGAEGAEGTNNLAVASFSANRDETDPAVTTVFVRVVNFRSQPAELRVELAVREGGGRPKLLDKPLTVRGRKVDTIPGPNNSEPQIREIIGEASVLFELRDLDESEEVVMHAKLLGVRDNLPSDNEAWLVVGKPRKAKVLLVGPPSRILRAFFDDDTTKNLADVTYLAPAELTDEARYLKPTREGLYDWVIYDRCAPATAEEMPRANTLFIGSAPPPWKTASLAVVKTPFVKGWQGQVGVLRGLTGLHEIAIGEAYRLIDLPPRTPLLMEGDDRLPLLLSLSRSIYTDLVMTFALNGDGGSWNTNWPLFPSFPLFLRSALYIQGNLSETLTAESTTPGQPRLIRTGPSVREVTVTSPKRETIKLSRTGRSEFVFAGTETPGVYTTDWGEGPRRFAVNILDVAESHIEPRTNVRLGTSQVASESETRKTPRDLWKLAALAALVLLLIEWWFYNHRVRV